MLIDNVERRLSVTLTVIWNVDGCWSDTRLSNTIDFPVIKIRYHKGKKISNISFVSCVISHMIRLQPRQSAATPSLPRFPLACLASKSKYIGPHACRVRGRGISWEQGLSTRRKVPFGPWDLCFTVARFSEVGGVVITGPINALLRWP